MTVHIAFALYTQFPIMFNPSPINICGRMVKIIYNQYVPKTFRQTNPNSILEEFFLFD